LWKGMFISCWWLYHLKEIIILHVVLWW
jgi:hypothetical protein